MSFLYELPFSPNKQYLSTGLLGAIIGNWQFSGISVFQKGIPLRVAASDTTGLLDFALNVGRANSLTQPRLRDPGRRSLDISLFRNQRIGERVIAQFRTEFYNISNTPALSLGNTSSVTVNAPQFGKVLIGTNPRNIQFGLRVIF